MRSFIRMLLLIVCLNWLPVSYAQNTDQVEQLQNQLLELKQEFISMKTHYEKRISDLEFRLEQKDADTLPKHGPMVTDTSTPVGDASYAYSSSIMNPDISVIIDMKQNFNDDVADDNRNKLTVGEAELQISGMLYPEIYGFTTIAVENEYSGESDVETEVDLEEGYIQFLALPFNAQLLIGRKLIDFGLINPVHPHAWSFTDTPLVHQTLFGHHPWYDDGGQLSVLIPNPWDLFWETKFGIWNGRTLGHSHDHDDESTHAALEDSLVTWGDMVFTGRSYLNIPLGDSSDIGFGYSIAWDEHPMTMLHGLDFTWRYRFANKNSWLKWQNELIIAHLDDSNFAHEHEEEEHEEHHISNADPAGFYSMLEYAINKYWRIGTRWDYTELNENEDLDTWANSYFVTYKFHDNLFARVTYRYRDFPDTADLDQEGENTLWFQLVWGLGPHSHNIAE